MENRKTINFGKINFNGTGKRNEADIQIELKEEDGKYIFSASASVWNSKHTDIVMGGQCIDDLFPYLKYNKLYLTILNLWEKYHLNDMHAGTEKQENFLKNLRKIENNGENIPYEIEIEELKKAGLYEDDGYKYGTGWLYREIPENDLKLIFSIIQTS